ncbi:hypothetical protein PsorP6_001876 [Peronosclerospora sorghi]|uniref:Uncharacterized protein n=1 Tax=Peronosclerospora sorghi TaxID=230839 RepID=A0ACC0WXA1_9STRA|nr:hypothetical protein PsorP6_001876 [Peronosclerospora sorghi]
MLRVVHIFRKMSQIPVLAAFYNTHRLVQGGFKLDLVDHSCQLASFLRGALTTITPKKFVAQHQELLKKLTGSFCLEQLLWRYSDAHLTVQARDQWDLPSCPPKFVGYDFRFDREYYSTKYYSRDQA